MVAQPAGHERRREPPRAGEAAASPPAPPPGGTRSLAPIEHQPSGALVRGSTDELIDLLVAASRVALGATATVVAVAADALRPAGPRPADRSTEPPIAALVTGAAMGAALDAVAVTRWAARAGWTAARWGAWLLPTDAARKVGREVAVRWDVRWQRETDRSRDAAGTFAREVVPEVVRAALETIDLNELVRENVDVDGIAAVVDVQAIAATLDLDALATRIDLDAIIERVDLDAIVARIDPNVFLERLDLDAAARRVDVATIAREVIDELDLLELIRESSATVTTDAVDDIRLGAVDADRAVARVVDRVLRRRSPRAVELDAARSAGTGSADGTGSAGGTEDDAGSKDATT